MMRAQYEPSANQQIKRVSVRTGGAGHAHSGVVRSEILSTKNIAADRVLVRAPKPSDIKIVKLGS
jgi:hypothetical protein